MHGNRISWDSHGNVTDNDCVMGTGVDRTRAMGMEMNFHYSFSTYYMRFCSVMRELGKHSHFTSTLVRPSREHVTFKRRPTVVG